MEAMLGKIELRPEPSIPGEWLNMRVTVEVVESGRTHTRTCTGPKGAWGQPPLTDADHEMKLRDCLSRGLEPAAIDELLSLLGRLEALTGAEVRRVSELIA
jgi:hypothetical protein